MGSCIVSWIASFRRELYRLNIELSHLPGPSNR